MSAYRLGDRVVEVAGQSYRLRLSVAALAQMASVFEAESPKALADCLRKADVVDWNKVFRCVATPILASDVTREELVKILPEISALIAEGLGA